MVTQEEERWKCGARQRHIGSEVQDCDWPVCGCDPYASKVLDAIAESGFKIVRDDPSVPNGPTGRVKEQPSYGLGGITKPWDPVSEEMQRGLELAAYICRMYGDGEAFAEAILSRGEQIRGRWWMEHEKRQASS